MDVARRRWKAYRHVIVWRPSAPRSAVIYMMNDWAQREFGSDVFDPTQYTHKALANSVPGNAPNEDISQLIGRLALAVDDVAGQIRSLVSTSVCPCSLMSIPR